MRKLTVAIGFAALMIGAFWSIGQCQNKQDTATQAEADTAGQAESGIQQANPAGKLVVYYFHGNRRCATCRKLEAYSYEALSNDFKSALADSSIVWRVVNFEAEGNEHFVEDYGLFTQSLILSRVVDGKEIKWRNLDKIWKLVHDKEQFLTYVTTETRNFLTPSSQ